MARSPLPLSIRRVVKERDGWRCIRCWSPDYLEVHHIRAVQDGGREDLGNLALLCSPCHAEWTFVAEPSTTVSWQEWLETPSYLALLSFWYAMRQSEEDGTVVMEDGSPLALARLAQDAERVVKRARPTRQRHRRESDCRPVCRSCRRRFPAVLPNRMEEYPEVCRACAQAPSPDRAPKAAS